MVNSNIPLLITRAEMKNLGIKLDLLKKEMKVLGETRPLLTTSDGLPAIRLQQGRKQREYEQINGGRDDNKNKGGKKTENKAIISQVDTKICWKSLSMEAEEDEKDDEGTTRRRMHPKNGTQE